MSIGVLFAFVVFLVGLFGGLPLGWLFLASSAAGLLLDGDSLSFIAGTFYHAINNYVIMSIAFFVFAGSLISDAGLADRIVRFSYALVGRVRGGMQAVGIVATLIMSSLTGSSVPCISALIPLLVPRLEKYGYQRRYTTALLCSSSFLGYLIPPSVPALIYCLVAQQSVSALFLATVIPGLLLALGYAILNYFLCHRYMDMSLATEVQERPLSLGESMTELGRATWSALPALGCPLVILVGIYGGIFTPNEAGAIAVVYCLFVGFFVYRELNRHTLWSSIFSSLVSIGVITILIAAGTVFARYLIRLGVAQELATFILQLFSQKILVLLAMNAFLLFLGMFIDGTPILILAVPLILPLVTQLGVNLVHLGAIVILNIGLGVITPPFAISIFVGSRLSGCSYTELVPIMLRFLLFVGIPVLLLTTYVPAISCWLPTLLLGPKVVGPW
ncbi:TRAP transporter large permease [Aminiphilus sp.]|uniref:TRAP transporter large permease n=1 Tax=Aminiphilus sp. TaxID=1872488 RepID=UPI002626ADE3|nr:TRAP transporter large permease [Aminiphilus sp.]